MDVIKVLILSFVEGITEFLPISSTGHLILVNDLLRLEPEGFANAFNIIIQLGAILAVVVLYFNRLNPFRKVENYPKSYGEWNTQTKLYWHFKQSDKETLRLWRKVIIGVFPAVVLGLAFDDYIDAHLMTTGVVTFTLFVYGIIILIMEKRHKKQGIAKIVNPADFSDRDALLIGLFQCLAMVPGTSRSAATIIGAMLLGASRKSAAEFSFFLAIPTMLGATFLKIIKNIGGFSASQWALILLGFVFSFLVAFVVIKRFMAYIRRHDFTVFGYYRIALALLLILAMVWK